MATNADKRSATKKKAAKRKPAKKKAAKSRPAAKKSVAASRPAAAERLPEVSALVEDAAKPSEEPLVLERSSAPSVTAAPDTIASRAGLGALRGKDITAFLRQLIMMLDSGTPILKSLKSLSQRGDNKAMRDMVGGIAEYVESGNPLWQAFAREGKYFPPVFVNLVKAAEAGGTLTTVLRRLVAHREQRDRLTKYVQVAMIYPAVLVFLCTGLLVLLSMFVIPAFREIFETMGAEIQGFSSFIMGTADFIANYWWLGALAVAGVVAFYQYVWIRSPLNRLMADKIKLRIPIFGYITQRGVIAEFMRTYAMLLRSGISMMATLDLCKNSTSNRAFVGVIQDMRDSVEAGEGLEGPLRSAEKNGYIPGIVADMLLTGEESGSLERVADQIAETYEEDLEIAVNALKEAITPAFVVFMGFIVGSIVLGMFLPLISMIENISSGGSL